MPKVKKGKLTSSKKLLISKRSFSSLRKRNPSLAAARLMIHSQINQIAKFLAKTLKSKRGNTAANHLRIS
jgi:hypothetical protein